MEASSSTDGTAGKPRLPELGEDVEGKPMLCKAVDGGAGRGEPRRPHVG